ncbi:MAG TPA: phosphate signaling complex protein PhoU [Acidimicrobiales bacterium]|nr:phosphate signaling complex protein PhoU [Acidimicrobiales bacterium]
MAEELRLQFHRDLAIIDEKVVQLFALVAEGLAAATDAFLTGDRDAARELVARDKLIDELYGDVETLVQKQFALQSPMARDLRFLITILRIVPELERSHDLAEHIAKAAARGLSAELPPRVRGLVDEMGRLGVAMWRRAADAYIDRDAAVADQLDDDDDQLDECHASLIAELASGQLSVPIATEMALIARFYERLGDHAVNVAKRVRYLASGER